MLIAIFKPNGNGEYVLKDGIVNQMGDSSSIKFNFVETLGDETVKEFYNALSARIGETIKIPNKAYYNSDWTLFINICHDKPSDSEDYTDSETGNKLKVYGQFNGKSFDKIIGMSEIKPQPDAQKTPI